MNMQKYVVKQKKDFSPTLNTIRMVEQTMEKIDEGIFSVSQLKKRLPKQINHYTLKNILEYLEESNKIYVSLKGMTWLVNDSPKLRKEIERSTIH